MKRSLYGGPGEGDNNFCTGRQPGLPQNEDIPSVACWDWYSPDAPTSLSGELTGYYFSCTQQPISLHQLLKWHYCPSIQDDSHIDSYTVPSIPEYSPSGEPALHL